MQTEYLFMVIAFIVAALVPYFFKRRLRKKTGLPETDERVLHQFQKFTLFIVCIISISGVLALGIYTLLGHDTLQINYIWLFLLLLILSLSVGAFLSKR
ncbi:hypothetical protein [Paenibacillus woosongensis]|uniref:Uncharacterized protein n=1 Tax=Paenibacillus woosongensis TaxID=307580 RepID=A0ABQ4MLD3_9BACL|nr:hypothetical protein [Paenibacillus woosongensis]GIP56792.1 hypothetical protein J15TS10_06060 [Paenibacillus woosongensis]